MSEIAGIDARGAERFIRPVIEIVARTRAAKKRPEPI